MMTTNAGIPHSLRPQLYIIKLIQTNYIVFKNFPSKFRWCRLSGAFEKKCSPSSLPYYKAVRESTRNEYFSFAKHIEKDLLRILPGNGCFSKADSPGIPRLRRVLRAIAWLYPDVGYCQGFGTVVAHLLLFLEEEDCFCLMW